jgi:hypothetical protein
MVKEAEVLGEWLGLSKYDAAGVVRKAKKCSSLALRDFPPEVSEEDRAAFLAKI